MTSQTIQDWLQQIQLDSYTKNFENSGYFDLAQCVSLTEEDLDSIGVAPLGHRKRILAHLPDADVVLGLVPAPPTRRLAPDDDYVNLPQEDDEYVNVQEMFGSNAPALPPKTTPPAVPSRPVPAPRPRKSLVRSRAGSDMARESEQLFGSPTDGQRKRPVPQPRSRMSPGLKQELNDSSAGSSDSLADSKNSQTFSKTGFASGDDVGRNSPNPARETDSPDVELASPMEMKMFKIGVAIDTDAVTSNASEDKTENEFLDRLAEIEKQINDDLLGLEKQTVDDNLELEKQSSDESDADGGSQPKIAVSAAALSGEAQPTISVAPFLEQPGKASAGLVDRQWKDLTEVGHDIFTTTVPLPPSFDGSGGSQRYDVPKSNGACAQTSYDIPNAPKPVEPQDSYDVPHVPVPVQPSYDVPHVPVPAAPVRSSGDVPPLPLRAKKEEETQDDTYDVPTRESDIYEPIWNASSQNPNFKQTKTNSLPTDTWPNPFGSELSNATPQNSTSTLPQGPQGNTSNNSGLGSFQTSGPKSYPPSNSDNLIQASSLLDFSPPVDAPKVPPMPADLSQFDPLQDLDTSRIRSAKRLEDIGDDEDGDIYDAPPPSFAPPALPPVRRPPPPVPPRSSTESSDSNIPQTLGEKSAAVENDYVEGSFDDFCKLRAESTTSSLGSRTSMPSHPPPPVPLPPTPTHLPSRKAPPPPITEEYHALDHDPFSGPPPKLPPLKAPPSSSSPRSFGRLDSDDELGGFSTDDNISLSDGGEFMDEGSEDLQTINKMVSVKPMTEKRIPIKQAASNQRTIERSGFLFKQDINQRMGGILSSPWTKRWVVFNGEDLRYYEEKKSMVSKRIIPVAIMRNVENEIKQGDSKPFRFKLLTSDRIYTFAAEKMDDLSLWTNSLMEAIIILQSKAVEARPGLWMNSPDREGFLKMDGMKAKVFVAIKGDKLCYYKTREDFKVGSPIHQIDMKLCAVKELAKHKIQLPTNYKTFSFTCDSVAESHMWKKAFEDAIAEGLSDTKIVEQVYEDESNRFCADCDASEPSWASINLGIVMCKRCAGIHRQLHTPASKVRSLKLDTKVWTPTVIKIFHVIGNKVANDFWNGAVQGMNKISPESDDLTRQQFIEAKYQSRKFCRFHPLKENMEALDEALCTSAQSEDVPETMKLIFSGANMSYNSDKYDPPMTSLQLAKKMGKTLQAEFLYHNGAEIAEKVAPGRRNSDNYRRRIVTHKGYLYKTGANQKDFLKRWCILEHCTLSYYADEKSMTAKDSIESKDMISLCVTKIDKQDFAFELHTTKSGGRVYLFGAESEEARQEWMKRVAQSFSPSDAISLITDFTQGGYVFLQDGAAASWEQCWLQLRGKELAFFNEHDQQFDGRDLRKLIGLKRFDDNGCAECFEKGFHFVIDFPGRAWYIQADAVQETESWFTVIQKFATESGNSLAEQQLTSENVPIVVDKCLSFVAAHGIQIQGIYRLNGQHSKIDRLLQEFHGDARSVHLKIEDHDVHDVANCLKRFFRTLNDPLLTKDMHDQWIGAAAHSDHDSKLQYYQYYLSSLPRVNYATLRKVVMHLNSVAEQEPVNKMGITNLASIFGPALMVVDQDADAGYRGTNHEIALFVDMIYYHKWLFDIQDTERDIEEKMKAAEEKIKRAETVKGHGGHIMIPIYVGKKSGDVSYNQRIPETMVAQTVVDYVVKAAGLSSKNWALFEVVCNEELERVIHYHEKVLPVLMNWSNWDPEYSATSYLCVKENTLYDKLDLVLDPTLSLFSELKLSEKKSFKKYYFEFKQSKLAYYKSAQATNPQVSWNVEDLLIYVGVESKRSPPTNWNITFAKANAKVTRCKETPFFGRTMSCQAADEMYRWLASMISAQHPEGLFPPRAQALAHTQSAPALPSGAGPPRGPRVLPDLPALKERKGKF